MTESEKSTQKTGKSGRKKVRGAENKKASATAAPKVEDHAVPTPPDAPAPAGEEQDAALERDALTDQLLRLQADFDNFRKRTQREREQLRRTAHSDLLEDLLPVIDHFELGLANAKQHDANPQVTEGFQLVHDQLMGALRRCGLESISANGEVFDPHLHEAITHLPSEEHPADTVITETRRGYRLGDQLLRAAQVVVSSGPQADPAGADTSGETLEEGA